MEVALTMTAGSVRASVAPPGVETSRWRRLARLEAVDADRWTVERVVEAQRTIRSWYEAAGAGPAGDRAHNGVYWFNQFYLTVTEGVGRELRDHEWGQRADGFLDRLDVEFYERYRQALCGDGPAPAWELLFKDANRRDRHPVQWALEGIHAHIVGDLAPAIARTLRDTRRHGRFPGPDCVEHRAYTEVNAILHRVMVRTLRGRDFAHGVPGLVTTLLPSVVGHGMDVYVRVLRQSAWVQAQLLWDLWDTPEYEEAVNLLGVHAAWYARQVTDLFPLRPRLDLETVGRWLDTALRTRRAHLGQTGRGADRLLRQLRLTFGSGRTA
jgi:uncharacterized protein DUF5995